MKKISQSALLVFSLFGVAHCGGMKNTEVTNMGKPASELPTTPASSKVLVAEIKLFGHLTIHRGYRNAGLARFASGIRASPVCRRGDRP